MGKFDLQVNDIKNRMQNAQRVLVILPAQVNVDKLASGLALYLSLKAAGKNVSINKVAELIGGPIDYIPSRFEPRDTLADNAAAKKLLEWEPMINIEEGIDELKKIWGL